MGTQYLGAEQAMVDEWVKAALLAKAAEFSAAYPGGYPAPESFVAHDGFATPGAAYPYVIFQCQSPPRDVRGVGITRVLVDTIYVVKAVAQVSSYDPLVSAARIIDAAMTAASGSAVADGLVLCSVREEQFSLIELDDGKQYRHFGGVFKIQAQA